MALREKVPVIHTIGDEEGEIIDDGDHIAKTETTRKQAAAVIIKFRDSEIALQFKLKIVEFFDEFLHRKTDVIDFDTLEESFFEKEVDNEMDTLSESSCEVVDEIKRDPLTISIDKGPLNDSNSSNVSYDLKHREENILAVVTESKPQQIRKESRKVCYNCGENHTFRQCKLPKNMNRIQSEMMRFRVVSEMLSAPKAAANQRGLKRYHNQLTSSDEGERFKRFVPGKISQNLMQALGLTPRDVPVHIYKMRIYGYPPGWLEELKSRTTKSNKLNIFGCDSSVLGFDQENSTTESIEDNDDEIDFETIITYRGFNESLEYGVRDLHIKHQCPPLSKNQNKKAFLRELNSEIRLQKLKKLPKTRRNPNKKPKLSTDDEDLSAGNENVSRMSPTIIELARKKQQILNELNSSTLSTSLKILEESIEIEPDEPQSETGNSFDSTALSIELGTPILNPISPYSCVPNMDNFSKNMSPIVHAENLPNATGNFRKLSKVIDKIRKKSLV